MRNLILVLRADARDKAEQAYMMYALRALIVRSGVDFPTYASYCESIGDRKLKDKRDGDEIYNDIIAGLRGGR